MNFGSPAKNANGRVLNSLIAPLNSAASFVNSTANSAASFVNSTANSAASFVNTAMNINTNASGGSLLSSVFFWGFILAVIAGIVVTFYYYGEDIKHGWDSFSEIVKGYFSPASPSSLPPPPETPSTETPTTPETSTDGTLAKAASTVEKVLPGGSEVFNVASNRFTYYDAQPLCKAFGAELATYEQVKDAWDKGADWCNYGWVKGQMAVYPTSDESYAKLQGGPEEQRMSCGTPGVNGGYFDNPELRFGVNCYGKRPAEKQLDATQMSKNAPISPDALAFDKKVNAYKSELDSIPVNPFSSQA